ncbi:short-chain dehydrogenase, partial [Corynebacterium sp. 13CS0277]|uniref:SDR family oxidoreductase n=1 Tax=Corynebacterium sp. 13CS0277 TaxID=2071994 RepID=UPI000D4327DD
INGIRAENIPPTPSLPVEDPDTAPGTPLARLGHDTDVANAAVFLLSEDAAFIHGAILPVDGGGHLRGRAAV